MENNKAYLNKLPLIFLIILAGVVAQEFFFNTLNRTIGNEEQIRMNLIFNQSIHFIMLFAGLGLALNKWKDAMISLGVAALIMIVIPFLFNGKTFGKSTTGVAMSLIINELLYTLPVIIFFALSKTTAKKIVNIIIALIILRGLSGVYFIAQGINTLKDNLSIDLVDYKHYISVTVYTCLYIFKILFYCELQNYIDGKEMKWQPRLLNPGNVYENLSATIVFFTLKVFIIAMVIGQAFQLYSLKFFMRGEFASFLKVYFYSNILNVLFGVVIVLFAAWYLRKFLLEYFVTYNITSKFTYWLTLLPGIGFIVWLFCLQNERAKNFSEKVDSINNFAGSNAQAVTAIIVIIMCLRLVFGLAGQAAGINVFAGILSLLFFVWLINQRSGYYFNLYLSLSLLLILLVGMLGWGERKYFVVFCASFSLVLFNTVQLLLIYPVYHFEDFSYIDNEEETPDEEGAVLAGFEAD
jgi:hypothetical protein